MKVLWLYRINTVNKTVRKVIVKKDDLLALQKLVGGYLERIPHAPLQHDVFVDKEALLKDNGDGFFTFNGHGPYKGNGVVIGLDSKFNTVEPTLTLEAISKKVKFL